MNYFQRFLMLFMPWNERHTGEPLYCCSLATDGTVTKVTYISDSFACDLETMAEFDYTQWKRIPFTYPPGFEPWRLFWIDMRCKWEDIRASRRGR